MRGLILTATFLFAVTGWGQPVDYERDVAPMIEDKCVFCHSEGGHQAGGLFLETKHAVQNLVNKDSLQKAGIKLVVPGDPEASYIIHKLRGDYDIVGAKMPPGFYEPLEPAEMDRLKKWIVELAD